MHQELDIPGKPLFAKQDVELTHTKPECADKPKTSQLNPRGYGISIPHQCER